MLLVVALCALPYGADAQRRCTRGIPCGNTCIARNRTCHVGPGSARAAPQSRTPQAEAAATAATVPDSMHFVASSRGRVYYWVGCSEWQALSRNNLRFYRTRADAESAGYTPSRSPSCAGPPDAWNGQAAGPAPPVASGECRVERITDGDTIVCSGERIRLLLIDAPETQQAGFGLRARLALEELLPTGTVVAIETDVQERDRYGRLLAYLRRPDGTLVNEEMVRRGYAVVAVYPPNVRYVERFRAAAERARQGGYGLWREGGFSCLPADYRAKRCSP